MTLGSMELYGGVHTVQRQITTQIPIEFCILVIGHGLSLGHGHCQSDYTHHYTMSFTGFFFSGKHLNPEEFHQAVENHLKNQESTSVFIDCRNFYESKIVSKGEMK